MLLDYWPQATGSEWDQSTLCPTEALAFMFYALVSFNAARKSFTSILFVVILLTETYVKESDIISDVT